MLVLTFRCITFTDDRSSAYKTEMTCRVERAEIVVLSVLTSFYPLFIYQITVRSSVKVVFVKSLGDPNVLNLNSKLRRRRGTIVLRPKVCRS